MDDQRFDNLSRIIARSTSRRATVKGIAAAIGGGVFAGVFGVRAHRAGAQGTGQPGDACDASDQCESGNCSGTNGRPGVCYCVDPDRPWVGCSCNEGTEGPCGGGGVICCPSNSSPGGAGVCVPDSVGCNPTGECRAYPEDACDVDADCCVGTCNEGTCSCTPGLGWEGCACISGAQGECGGGSLLCCPTGSEPGGPGICTSGMTGCNPTGSCTSDPGGDCSSDDDCCTGACMSGTCACLDPSRPWIGCACDTGEEEACGGGSVNCCPTTTTPGGPGICTSASVGCEVVCTSDPGGECGSDDDCCTGTCMSGICACEDPARPWVGCPCENGEDNQCGGGTILCCPDTRNAGGPGTCTPDSVGCQTPPLCQAPGDSCSADGDCCVGTCMSGICACEDPSRPWVGCPCEVGSSATCDSHPELCCTIGQEPGSPGVCASPMTGCNPTGKCEADPGETCMVDSDCCEGKCSDDHVCYCADPAEPLRNCSCHSGTEHPCGDDTLLCCDTDGKPGGDGICIPDRLGCESVGHCAVKGDACLHDDDCCDKLICHDKKCGPKHHGPKPTEPVTTLPSTGSGSDGGSDLGAWLGVTAAAGAAAILAGRKLNQKPAEGTDEA